MMNRVSAVLARLLVAGAAISSTQALAQWERIDKPPQSDGQAYSIALARDGVSYATVGITRVGAIDAILFTRHNADGSVAFQRILQGARNNVAWDIVSTTDGGWAIAGETDAIVAGQGHTTLIKLSAAGALMWARAWQGGIFNDRPISVGLRETSQGQLILVSRSRQPGAASQFGMAALTQGNGAPVWSRVYIDPRFDGGHMAFADVREIRTAAGGPSSYVICGYSASNVQANKAPIALTLDPAGNNVITRAYSLFTAQENAYANGLMLLDDGRGVRITGQVAIPGHPVINGDMFVMDTDPVLFPPVPAATYDRYTAGHAAIERSRAGVSIIAGDYNLNPEPTSANRDAMLINHDGAPFATIWAGTYGGQRTDYFEGVQVRGFGLLAAGATNAFDPNAQWWEYNAATTHMGVDTCERRPPAQPITNTVREVAFQCPSTFIQPLNYGVEVIPVVPNQRVVCRPCPADFNLDGVVDFFDYDDFVLCFEGVACPAGRDADFNEDGSIDFFDYDDFVAAFNRPC